MHHWVLANIGRQNSWLLQFALTTLVLAWPGRHFFSRASWPCGGARPR